MDNREEILDALNDFSRKQPKEIPLLLEQYLKQVAKTGETLFPWAQLKGLISTKMDQVMIKLNEEFPSDHLLPCPNVENVRFDVVRKRIMESVQKFRGAPFTIQRLCELLTDPKRHYKRCDKFLRGLEKNVLVVSTVDPFGIKVVSESKVMVNGMDPNISPVSSPSSTSLAVATTPPVPVWSTAGPTTVWSGGGEVVGTDIVTSSSILEIADLPKSAMDAVSAMDSNITMVTTSEVAANAFVESEGNVETGDFNMNSSSITTTSGDMADSEKIISAAENGIDNIMTALGDSQKQDIDVVSEGEVTNAQKLDIDVVSEGDIVSNASLLPVEDLTADSLTVAAVVGEATSSSMIQQMEANRGDSEMVTVSSKEWPTDVSEQGREDLHKEVPDSSGDRSNVLSAANQDSEIFSPQAGSSSDLSAADVAAEPSGDISAATAIQSSTDCSAGPAVDSETGCSNDAGDFEPTASTSVSSSITVPDPSLPDTSVSSNATLAIVTPLIPTPPSGHEKSAVGEADVASSNSECMDIDAAESSTEQKSSDYVCVDSSSQEVGGDKLDSTASPHSEEPMEQD